MTVYIVFWEDEDYRRYFHGVYSTKESANREVRYLEKVEIVEYADYLEAKVEK